jgi:hypothetical protein
MVTSVSRQKKESQEALFGGKNRNKMKNKNALGRLIGSYPVSYFYPEFHAGPILRTFTNLSRVKF